MKTKTAIMFAGSVHALRNVFNPPLSRQAILQWGKDVPLLRAFQLREVKPEWFDPAWVASYKPPPPPVKKPKKVTRPWRIEVPPKGL